MSENTSAKYCQENKERLQKKLVKDIKILLKKKNKKEQQYERVVVKKNLSECEKINWLRIETNIIK